MSNNYKPAPIDVSQVVLPAQLTELVEKLSENVHEIWASERIKNGWSYGKFRDDAKKETPCLVEYAALPEGEKEYDRAIVEGILKTILKLGYTVSRKNFVDSS